VLENLIKNGIDALKDGVGEIVLSLDDGADGTVQLRVRDTGCGIAPQHRNRIFEAGYTTKSRGWGMGLALVRRIVVQYHKGRIQIEETGAGGTTFLITLPGEEPFVAV
jgi:signal transduction histidine kinase